MRKVEEMRAMELVQLQELMLQHARDLLNLRLQHAQSRQVKSHRFQQLRREMARIKTVVRQRELQQERLDG